MPSITKNRIGPDVWQTHWMLYFKSIKKRFINKKFKYCHDSVDIRPFATVISTENIYIGKNVVIRPFTIINATGSFIRIEDDVLLASAIYISVTQHVYKDHTCSIRDQGHQFKPVIIKKGAWLGHGVTILQGVTIGKNAIIGAGAVVTKNVPDYSVYGGVPARPLNIKQHNE